MMRQVRIPLLIALSAFVVWKGIIPAWTTVDSDFPNYYTGSHLVLAGVNCDSLYNNAWFGAQAVAVGLSSRAAFIPFPPATVFVMMPVAWLAPLPALRAWTLLNIALLLVAIVLLRSITKRDAIWCALIVLASGQALANNFRLGQAYLVLTVGVLLIYRGMQRDRSFAAGVALGVGAAIKYFPAMYALLLVNRKEWRTLFWAGISFTAIVIAAIAVVGIPAHVDFLSRIIFSMRERPIRHWF